MPTLEGARSSQAPRKRTLSTKSASNGDPHAERKRQKLDKMHKTGTKKALTKNKPTNTTSKKTAATGKVAKMAPEQPSVDVEEVPEMDNSDVDMHDNPAPSPEFIEVDDDEGSVEVPEEPEESAEAELSMFFSS